MVFPGERKTSVISRYTVDIVLSVFTSFSIVYALTYTMKFDYHPFIIFLSVLLAVLICLIIFLNRLTTIITIISAGVAACSWLLYLAWNKLFPGLANSFTGYVSWLYDYSNGSVEINEIYRDYTFILLVAGLSLAIYLFTIKRLNFPMVLSTGMSIFVIQWVMEYAINYLSFYLFVFLSVLYYLKHIYIKKRLKTGNDYTAPASFMINILPLCAVIFIFSFAIPKSESPVEWEWLDRQINKIYDFMNDNFKFTSYEYFSFHSTGFGQDEDRLGGKVKIDKTPVLRVETPRRIYLKGACKDFYTGYSWINSDNSLTVFESFESLDNLENPESLEGLVFVPGDYVPRDLEVCEQREHFCEALEPLIGLYVFSNNYDAMEKLLEGIEINITYLNLSTKTLFTSLKMQNIIFPPGTNQAIYTDKEGMFSFEKRLGKGYQYTLKLYGIDYLDEDITGILRKSWQGFYSNMPEGYRSIIERNARRDSIWLRGSFNDYIEMLSERAARIYDKYLQLPPGIPERILELAKAITSGKGNKYDKVKAIEEYLSRNYTYTLKPGPTPKGRDFVDYFLFDLKEGYCTYFASSMVILSRLAGIPARYVEGYMLPPEPEDQNTYRVTNQNAHAWVEVYFEGFGWVPFEPTAPFAYSFYNGSEFTGMISESFYEGPYFQEYMEMIEMHAPSIFDGFTPSEETETANPRLNIRLFFIWMIVVLIAMLVLFMVISTLKRRYFFSKIKRMSPRDSIIELVGHYINILSAHGFPMEPGETPLEYSRRINNYFIFEKYSYKNEDKDSFAKRILNAEELQKYSFFGKTMDLFVLARYSPAEMMQSHKNTVLAFYGTLVAEIKDNLGITKYFIYRYLLGRI